MKTLDEVIKAWSICFSDISRSDCTGCPYADEDGEAACFNHDREDALHYLKAFRDAKNALEAEKERYAEAVRNCEEAENKYKALELGYIRATADIEDNPPLTWDELRQMVGKPVWYEHEFWKGWIILGKVEQGVNCEMIPDREERWYIVKDGSAKAYRKERS